MGGNPSHFSFFSLALVVFSFHFSFIGFVMSREFLMFLLSVQGDKEESKRGEEIKIVGKLKRIQHRFSKNDDNFWNTWNLGL